MPDIQFLDQRFSVRSCEAQIQEFFPPTKLLIFYNCNVFFLNLYCDPGHCYGKNIPTVVPTVVPRVVYEGNTPEFSASVQDSIHVLLAMLTLLFSVQIQIPPPDNRTTRTRVSAPTLALSVDVCIRNPEQPGRSVAPLLEKTQVISEDEVTIRNIN